MLKIDQDRGMTLVATDLLPALTGSEKQIAWATDLRIAKAGKLANDFDNQFSNLRNAGKLRTDQREEFLVAYVKAKCADLTTETSAKYWIDRR
jgi:hypothetical protein